ncbi:glycosyltransferase [Agromyces sp. NPDC055520]
MTDLVVVSLEGWDAVWRRNQHLVAGLLARDPALRVLFVEPPADPTHDLRSKRRPRVGAGLSEIDGIAPGRLHRLQLTKWMPRRFDPRTDRRLASGIVRAAARLGMRHPLLWINDPGMAVLAESTGWPMLYDITDDWLAADRPAAELERIVGTEASLMRLARVVVVCSPELVRRKQVVRPVTLIPNAVDAVAYRRPVARPHDLPGGPVALYLGTVHRDRIDVALCAATARAIGPDASLVLVGPNVLSPGDDELLRLAGVVLLGPRPREEVIGYLQHADVLVVPHVITAFTDSLDPIKLYEYQAVGRPVVSTAVAGFRDVDDPRVTIADGGEFVDAVAAALPAKWRFPAHVGGPVVDWSERVDAMEVVLRRLEDPTMKELRWHFFIDGETAAAAENWDPDLEPSRFASGIGHNLLELGVRLRQRGAPITIGSRVPADSSLVVYFQHAWTRTAELRLAQRTARYRTALIRSDAPLWYRNLLTADLVVVPNQAGIRIWSERTSSQVIHLPALPQRGIVVRDPQRVGIRTVEFKGNPVSVPETLRDPRLRDALAGLGAELIVDVPGKTDGSDQRWHDFSAADVVLCLRDAAPGDSLLNKPATRLINAWRAGAIPLVGAEPAYLELVRDGIDGFVVRDSANIIRVIERLIGDPGLERAVRNAVMERAMAYEPDAVLDEWVMALTEAAGGRRTFADTTMRRVQAMAQYGILVARGTLGRLRRRFVRM